MSNISKFKCLDKKRKLPEQKNGGTTGFATLNLFCSNPTLYKKIERRLMKSEEVKTATKALSGLTESYSDLLGSLRDTNSGAEAAKKLWRAGNKSKLIKIGLAVIMFPEPTPISPCVGACFVVAGAIQKGIQNRALFLEDVTSSFRSTLRDVWAIKSSK